MTAARLLSLGFACTLLATLSVAAGATPLAGPCVPAAAYDPACDVNQDGQITVTDIQLTASHWNQSGTWLSDNQHNHLGQTWTGSNNTLKIEGSFGAPDDNAALRLTNMAPSGNGLDVPSAGYSGVSVGAAGSYGLSVISAGEDGVFIGNAGDAGVAVYYAAVDGVYEFRVGSPSSFHESAAKTASKWPAFRVMDCT